MNEPATRDRILDAALQVFTREGFHGATMRSIADSAGITPGSIYWYFSSKENLFRTVLKERTVMPEVLVTASRLDDDPRVVLKKIAITIDGFIKQPGILDFYRMLISELGREPQIIQKVMTETITPVGMAIIIYFKHQMEQGRFQPGNPVVAAQMFMGALIGQFIGRYLVRLPIVTETPIEEVLEQVVETFVTGLEVRGSGK